MRLAILEAWHCAKFEILNVGQFQLINSTDSLIIFYILVDDISSIFMYFPVAYDVSMYLIHCKNTIHHRCTDSNQVSQAVAKAWL